MSYRKYNVKEGQKYGKLTIIKEIYLFKNNRNTRYVVCLCDCGKETTQRIVDIFTTISSCGCNRGKNKGTKGHGYSYDTIYKNYTRLIFRCYNKNNKDYKYYGGRNIGVCKEWRENPASFCKWAYENGYKKGLTIERNNNNKDYSPENCSFVTMSRQANNKRDNYIIENMSMADFCRKHNLIYQRFHDRIIRLNWAVEKAMLNCSKF